MTTHINNHLSANNRAVTLDLRVKRRKREQPRQ